MAEDEYNPAVEYLTAADAAARLDVHPATIRNAIRAGRLPCVRMYGRVLIDPTDLDVYQARARPDGEKPKGRPRKQE